MRRIKPFDYYRPYHIHEVLSLLKEFSREAKVLAGGTDLLVSMKMKGLTPSAIINLKAVEGLDGINHTGGQLRLGPLSTIHSLSDTAALSQIPPVVAMACKVLGTPQIRNLATIGGNLCNASPAADLPPPLLVLEAKLKIMGPSSSKLIPLEHFFVGPGMTIMEPDEILTDIYIPIDAESIGIYLKHGIRRAHDLAIASVSVLLRLEKGNDRLAKARIALGAVAPTPLRVKTAEEILIGERLSKISVESAARAAVEESKPISDVRASADYRKQMVKVLVEQSLMTIQRLHNRSIRRLI